MLPHRDSMVRRAVARHIICQVRRRQAAKHRRLLGRRALSVCDAGIVACSSDSDSSYAATEPELATTAAAISALATAMAAARTDPRAVNHLTAVVCGKKTSIPPRIINACLLLDFD
ncbi:hypothetical protein EV181_000300 [Coemansia sp. RSA 532]|nr:hypothetical protein EV181_000300 [Coemansia sp. RSA 532]